VHRIFDILSSHMNINRCAFNSSTWKGDDAPPVWSQAMRIICNPSSLRMLREEHRRTRPDAWLVHNVFPVGSAAIYHEALKCRTPIIHYIHNFRPFSVNGYLWAGDEIATAVCGKISGRKSSAARGRTPSSGPRGLHLC
jgi:hypothetical protein